MVLYCIGNHVMEIKGFTYLLRDGHQAICAKEAVWKAAPYIPIQYNKVANQITDWLACKGHAPYTPLRKLIKKQLL